jgi:hypothetical protein
LPKDMVRREANHTKNERQHARNQKEQLNGVARAAAKAPGGGGDKPLLSQSLQEMTKRMRKRGR